MRSGAISLAGRRVLAVRLHQAQVRSFATPSGKHRNPFGKPPRKENKDPLHWKCAGDNAEEKMRAWALRLHPPPRRRRSYSHPHHHHHDQLVLLCESNKTYSACDSNEHCLALCKVRDSRRVCGHRRYGSQSNGLPDWIEHWSRSKFYQVSFPALLCAPYKRLRTNTSHRRTLSLYLYLTTPYKPSRPRTTCPVLK
eukprot:20707-Rhodomonas_salina.3